MSGLERIVAGMSTDGDGIYPHGYKAGRLDLPAVFGGQWVRGQLIDPGEESGQAYVFLARRQKDGRAVALKVIRGNDAQALQRFEIEVSAMQRCEGFPNIIRHIDSGLETWKGRTIAWIVMELVENPQNFIEYLKSRERDSDPVAIRTTLQQLRDLARALHRAHQVGVIHRDLKPQNVLVGSDGIPKLCDFGLAVPLLTEGARVLRDPGKNAIVGTWQYMSPEHVADNPDSTISAASDIYAFGVLMYEALAGDRPFNADPGSMPSEVARQTIRHTPPRPIQKRERRIGSELAYIVHRCLEKDPQKRYESAAALANDIDDLLRNQPLRSRMTSPSYLFQYGLRARVIKHRKVLTAAMLVVVALFALFVFRPLLERTSHLDEYYQQTLQMIPYSSSLVPPLDDVRVIAYILDGRDPADPEARLVDGELIRQLRETDFDYLQSLPGMEHIDRENARSWRSCTGELLKRLSASGVRVIANNFNFPAMSEPANDQALIDGILAVHAAGVPYVQGLRWWTRTPFEVDPVDGLAALVEGIGVPARIDRMGTCTGNFAQMVGWIADLAIRPPDSPWVPSFETATLAAWHGFEPGTPLQADTNHNRLELLAPSVTPGNPRPNLKLRPTTIQKNAKKYDPMGVGYSDLVATVQLAMPSDRDLSSIIWNIDDVLRSDPETLRRAFAGKAVFIVDIRIEPYGCEPHPGGRFLPRSLLGVVSFATIVSGTPMIKLASFFDLLLEIALGSAAGMLIAIFTRRLRTRVLLVVALLVGQILLSVILYRFFNRLTDPSLPTLSMVLSMVLTHVVVTPWRISHEYLANPVER